MSKGIDIRPVQKADFAVWKVLWDGYNAFYGREGALLGLAHYLFHRSTIQFGPSCYLQDLFTAEAARGEGVGRSLIEAVYRRAAEVGAKRVYWQTQASNLTARRLYDAVAEDSGFVVYRKTVL